MNIGTQKKKAQTLLSQHTNGKLLILPNIWNPIGARVLESKGYSAVATTRKPWFDFAHYYNRLIFGTTLN
jgi:2-methylisocitrate lyase-like PEP mutase family enzyme